MEMDTLEVILLFMFSISMSVGVKEKDCAEEPDGGFFYYFAYGSNMLSERMHINCKAARNYTSAKLEKYRLDFNMSSRRWNGAVATIVRDGESVVWGNVWLISIFEGSKLDEQEGVQYYSKELSVKLTCGKTVSARVYISHHPPAEKVPPENLPPGRQPSKTYQQVILLGALQSHLPASYLNYLLRFPNNRRLAPSSTRKSLGYPFYDSSLP